MGVGAGHAHKNIHIHTHVHTVSLHPLLSNGLSDHLFNTVNKQDKTAGGLLRQCNPTLKWVEHTELHTHVGSQVYTCPNVHSQKRKCLPIESLNKNHSCILRKTLSSNGFIRATESLTKLAFFHPFPIFLLAFGLHPGGRRFGKLYLLWNHTLSFSRHGRAPEAMHHLECCVSTQPPSGGSHQHCAALVCASQAPPPTPATALNDITIWRSRLSNASFQTPLCVVQSWENTFEAHVANWKLDHSYVMVAPISVY